MLRLVDHAVLDGRDHGLGQTQELAQGAVVGIRHKDVAIPVPAENPIRTKIGTGAEDKSEQSR